jgi:hypothetical protein
MELSGTAYLYNLSLLATTFIGFSVIVLTLCQALGHKPSNFDALLAHLYMEYGLVIAVSSLLPVLLTAWELPAFMAWRLFECDCCSSTIRPRPHIPETEANGSRRSDSLVCLDQPLRNFANLLFTDLERGWTFRITRWRSVLDGHDCLPDLRTCRVSSWAEHSAASARQSRN